MSTENHLADQVIPKAAEGFINDLLSDIQSALQALNDNDSNAAITVLLKAAGRNFANSAAQETQSLEGKEPSSELTVLGQKARFVLPLKLSRNPGPDQPLFPSVVDSSGLPHGQNIVFTTFGNEETVKARSELIVRLINEFCGANANRSDASVNPNPDPDPVAQEKEKWEKLVVDIRTAIAAFCPADENIEERPTLDALNVLFRRIAKGRWPSDEARSDVLDGQPEHASSKPNSVSAPPVADVVVGRDTARLDWLEDRDEVSVTDRKKVWFECGRLYSKTVRQEIDAAMGEVSGKKEAGADDVEVVQHCLSCHAELKRDNTGVATCWKCGTSYDGSNASSFPQTPDSGEPRAELAATVPTQNALTWRPMQTAPMDGTVIDLWTNHGRYVDCFWGKPHHECGEAGPYCDSDWHTAEPGWVDGTFGEFLPAKPTHWMNGPTAPSVGAVEKCDNVSGFLQKVVGEDAIQRALERLASSEGFVAVGMLPDNQWGKELRARMDFAEAALSSHGVSSSAQKGEAG